MTFIFQNIHFLSSLFKLKMKIRTLQILFAVTSLWYASTAFYPGSPPTGSTGAQGESTCNSPGCHQGGTYTGSSVLTGVPDTVVAGSTYTLTLTHKSNAVKSGFQLTALDGNNIKSGNLVAGTGTALLATLSRQYIGQSQPKTLSAGTTNWTFKWVAPTLANANKITFHFVTLAANGNGNEGNDNSLKDSKTVYFKKTSPTADVNEAALVRTFPNPVVNELTIDLLASATGEVSIFDLSGKLLQNQTLINHNTLNISNLAKGIYVVSIKTNNQTITKRILKN